jgi:hypothetical protein
MPQDDETPAGPNTAVKHVTPTATPTLRPDMIELPDNRRLEHGRAAQNGPWRVDHAINQRAWSRRRNVRGV